MLDWRKVFSVRELLSGNKMLGDSLGNANQGALLAWEIHWGVLTSALLAFTLLCREMSSSLWSSGLMLMKEAKFGIQIYRYLIK